MKSSIIGSSRTSESVTQTYELPLQSLANVYKGKTNQLAQKDTGRYLSQDGVSIETLVQQERINQHQFVFQEYNYLNQQKVS